MNARRNNATSSWKTGAGSLDIGMTGTKTYFLLPEGREAASSGNIKASRGAKRRANPAELQYG
jgi:hypothetical protein